MLDADWDNVPVTRLTSKRDSSPVAARSPVGPILHSFDWQGSQNELREGKLVMLIRENDGRLVLDDVPIHAGDVLEVWLDGQWVVCRFEWMHLPELTPALFFSEKGQVMQGDELLRWPQR